MSAEHLRLPEPARCEHCGFETNWLGALGAHRRRHERELAASRVATAPTPADPPGVLMACDGCGMSADFFAACAHGCPWRPARCSSCLLAVAGGPEAFFRVAREHDVECRHVAVAKTSPRRYPPTAPEPIALLAARIEELLEVLRRREAI